MLGRFNENKMAATRKGAKITAEEAQERAGRLTPKERLRLTPCIGAKEIKLDVRDIPVNKAPGPSLLPAEMYIKCPSMHKGLAGRNYISKRLRRFFIAPLDNAGKGPTQYANKRPIALLSPMIKALRMALVRRITPYAEDNISRSQFAFQRARTKGIPQSDLDRFAPQNARDKKPPTW